MANTTNIKATFLIMFMFKIISGVGPWARSSVLLVLLRMSDTITTSYIVSNVASKVCIR